MTGCTFKQQNSKMKSVVSSNGETERLLLNITNRQANLKELSSYLSELESQLALIFAASPDIIVLLDKGAKILKISDAAYSVLNYKKEELVGKCLWDFIALDDLDKTKERFLTIQQQTDNVETNALVNRWISKNGTLIKLVWRFSLFDSQKNYTIGIASDVSIFGANEKYDWKSLQKAVDLSADGVIVTDSLSRHNTIVYVNDSFCKLTGYAAEEEKLITWPGLFFTAHFQKLASIERSSAIASGFLSIVRRPPTTAAKWITKSKYSELESK